MSIKQEPQLRQAKIIIVIWFENRKRQHERENESKIEQFIILTDVQIIIYLK
jgi:hypothetical protein